MSVAVVWFRRDLRLEDNPALAAALHTHERVVLAYVHAPDEEAPWMPGAASRWWLHHALGALMADVRTRGAELCLRTGPSAEALGEIVRASGASAVHWNRLYEPAIARRDARAAKALRASGVEVQTHNAHLLCEPDELRTRAGEPYRVFTPFWRNAREAIVPRPPVAAPKTIDAMRLGGTSLEALGLLPRHTWDGAFYELWRPGERGAQAALRRFCDDALGDYARLRDFPAERGTSRLSAHLHFGEIGPRQVLWAVAERARGRDTRMRAAVEAFVRELGWREFAHHLLAHNPRMADRNLDTRFDAFPWARRNARLLERWQQGRTGVPIVDAGMRELWTTGFMHNRVRMIVASFLTKHLRQHWKLGARWFWDTLVDADLANNSQGWQWSAGCGADAAPYFRIFNPVTQAERFDPHGAYVRRWIPELADFPGSHVHAPWKMPELLHRVGYPSPIVDLDASRAEALAAFRSMRGAT